MSEYHFTTRWIVPATCEMVYGILENAEDLKRWWPSVYLDVKTLEEGQPGGIGKTVALYTKGWLPYTLHWKFRVTRVQFPAGFALEAMGDFVGTGVWTFTQLPAKDDGAQQCEVVYDWRIRAEKPLLRRLTPVLRPIFSANHHWAMRKGLESLLIELARLKAVHDGRVVDLPKPPGPTFPHNLQGR